MLTDDGAPGVSREAAQGSAGRDHASGSVVQAGEPSPLSRARSAFSLVLVLLFFVPGSLWQRLVVWPACKLFPRRRRAIVSWYMRGMSRAIFGLLELGGARFERRGRLPTRTPILVLMNHQSLLDITTVVMLSEPCVPAFVTRARYARFVPAVSLCLRLLEAPIIDPRRDPRGAVAAIERAAARERHGLLVFPEGHRTRDGGIGPFRTAGAEAVLRAQPMPIYLAVTDGFHGGRRLFDFVWNVGRLHGRTEILGPFQPPAEPAAHPAFLQELRGRMVAHLREMRSRADARG